MSFREKSVGDFVGWILSFIELAVYMSPNKHSLDTMRSLGKSLR